MLAPEAISTIGRKTNDKTMTAVQRIATCGVFRLREMPPSAVPEVLGACDLYVWPGNGEAYGLAYLEAQSMGLPVVAQATGGVSAVVVHGETGWLTPAGDLAAYSNAIRWMLADGDLRVRMGMAASRFVREQRSIGAAAAI